MRRNTTSFTTEPSGSAPQNTLTRRIASAVLRVHVLCSPAPDGCQLRNIARNSLMLGSLFISTAALCSVGAQPVLAAAASIATPTYTEPRVHEPTVAVPTVQAPTISAPPLQPSSAGQRPGWAGNTQTAGDEQPSRGREIMGFLFGGQLSEEETGSHQPSAAQNGQTNHAPASAAPTGHAPATGQVPTLSPTPVPPPAPVAPTPAVAAPRVPKGSVPGEMQPQSPEAQLRQQQLNQERERQRQERGRQNTQRTPRGKAADSKKEAVQHPAAQPAKTPDAAPALHAPANALPENAKGPEKPEPPVTPGTPAAQANEAYQKGDYAQARAIWQHLADGGDGQAMNNLGVLFDLGQGVDLDEGRALYWYARSASAGHPSGMSNYGRMLEQGRGIDANPEEAARWFDLAAREGQPEAQYNLGLMYESGHGVPQDHKAAAAWYSRAAAQQQTDALARLGQLYRTGQGVEKNQARATLLLYAAAMRGSVHAMKELEDMAGPSTSRPGAVLFGLRLDTATRPAMREALGKAGMQASRQDDAYICDTYTPGALVPGARQAAFCYGPGRPAPLGFVELEYTVQDKATAQSIVHMVSERFGAPSAGESDDDHIWNLGSVVVATRYEPARQLMSLMYMVPAVYHLTRQD